MNKIENKKIILKKREPSTGTKTIGEEIANSITHGQGTVFSIIALIVLLVLASKRHDPWRVVSFSIYGASLILLYLSSTLYHSFLNPRLKDFFRILDHSAILLLIAGTYTPITLISLRGVWGWSLFAVIWGMAIGGILIMTFFLDKLKNLMILLYVMMGVLIMVAFKPMKQMLPAGMMRWLFIGGASYILGIIFYLRKKIFFHHPIWHLFVLGVVSPIF